MQWWVFWLLSKVLRELCGWKLTYLLAKWALPFSEAAKNKVVIYCCTFVNLTMYFSKIPQHIAFMVLYKMEGQVLSFYFFLPPPQSLKQI